MGAHAALGRLKTHGPNKEEHRVYFFTVKDLEVVRPYLECILDSIAWKRLVVVVNVLLISITSCLFDAQAFLQSSTKSQNTTMMHCLGGLQKLPKGHNPSKMTALRLPCLATTSSIVAATGK